jgi:isopentenyl diphosphate isomerase/L-lactate dehydrogenase-like FMN-dependent dehydrogenase
MTIPESVPLLLTVEDYARRAKELLPSGMWGTLYGDDGAPDFRAETGNVEAFRAIRFRPRVLVDVQHRNLATEALGAPISLPVMIAPSGHQQRVHRDGETATARAAAASGTIMVLSTASSFSIEEVALAASGTLWFQLYWMRDRRVTQWLVRRAEDSGYKAIVLTVDMPGIRSRERDVRHEWNLADESKLGRTLEPDRLLRNFSGLEQAIPGAEAPTQAAFNEAWDDSVTWKDLDWLRSFTTLPIVLKGVQTAEDAELAVQYGAEGLIVSNHGGFALDDATPTIEVLPEVAEVVNGRLEVFLDGGVRTGSDVLKALALGARAVLLGRAPHWALAVNGEQGLRDLLEILRIELNVAMAFAGTADVNRVNAAIIRRG